MTKVILLAPLYSNGGITSWTKKYISQFPNEEFELLPISQVLGDKDMEAGLIERTRKGLPEVTYVLKQIRKTVEEYDVSILHTTTSGSLGTYRDYRVAKLCKQLNIKMILHCHYGLIPQILRRGGLFRCFLLHTMRLYDQIWVLDRHTLEALKAVPGLEGKVMLTPNSIEVNPIGQIAPKQYRDIAFVGNVLPTKGIYELVAAVLKVHRDVRLHIVGPANKQVLCKIKEMAGDKIDRKIFLYGRLDNSEAVRFMAKMDVVALPTYYPSEAFPISILEAMSKGKLVISTPCAAIPDMLTALDGSRCGIIVPEKSIDELVKAMKWAIDNPSEADKLCVKAYAKVWDAYRTDIVYEQYRDNYRKLLE